LPFSDPNRSLRDIVDATGMIEQFTADIDFEAFREDPKTVAAVERKLQITSEAATRLGKEAEKRFHWFAMAEYSWHLNLERLRHFRLKKGAPSY
jgi:uncharacterized protein with HEPN domain